MSRRLTPARAVALVEGREEGTDEQVLAAWQYLVDTGLAWSLQGSIGRQAHALIAAGLVEDRLI